MSWRYEILTITHCIPDTLNVYLKSACIVKAKPRNEIPKNGTIFYKSFFAALSNVEMLEMLQ